jgi:hypothetical protein
MLPFIGPAGAQAATSTAMWTPLTLVNGWTNYGFGTASAAVASINGIVHLKGAIKTTGTTAVAFTLPSGDRPATKVYVPVDLCNTTNGRLYIAPTGEVTVETQGPWSDAQCFTSLDGVTFAKSASSFTPLSLLNGWTSYGSGTASPAVRNISGIVYLKGAIKTTGTNAAAFVLPAADRPATRVSVPADLFAVTSGQLTIQPSGTVTVEPNGLWSNAQGFTSLDGVSFATSAASTPLTLENGWADFGFLFPGPAVTSVSGIVHLRGAIVTTGTNPVPFTLPVGFRPASEVYVKVSLCNAANGRLDITPSGTVTVDAEGGVWSNAQCFTSLDGASFAP